MKGLLGLIGQIAALNVTRTVARAKRSGIMIGISVLLFLTAYMFGLIALALRLARDHPPEVAALFVATMFVGADSMSRALGVPSFIADVIVALSLLAMLVALSLANYRIRR